MKKEFLVIGAVVIILFLTQGLPFSTIAPMSQVTLSDDKQYWLGTFACDSAPIGSSFSGTLKEGNTTIGDKIYSRKASVMAECIPQQPYLATTASLSAALNSCTQGSFPCNQIPNSFEKLTLPNLGEKHAPYVFNAYSLQGDASKNFFDSVTYDQIGGSGAIQVGTTGVFFSEIGRLGSGYQDVSLNNVLLFRGKNSFICGSGVGQCDFQLESTAFSSRSLSDSELIQYGFPFLQKTGCYLGDCRVRIPSEIFDQIQRSSSWSLSDSFGAALRKYAAVNPPLGGVATLTYKGLSAANRVRWDYTAKSDSPVLNVRIPLAFADTFIYDIPNIQTCSVDITAFSLGQVGAQGAQATLKIKNSAGSTCMITAIPKVETGYQKLSFNPPSIQQSLRVGQEGDFSFFVNSLDIATGDNVRVCVTANGGLAPVTKCVDTTVNTGGKPPVPTATPSPNTNCNENQTLKTETTTDLLGQSKTVTTCVDKQSGGGNACLPFLQKQSSQSVTQGGFNLPLIGNIGGTQQVVVTCDWDSGAITMLVIGLLALFIGYGLSTGAIEFADLASARALVPVGAGVLTYFVVSGITLPFLGAVFAGFAPLAGLIVGLIAWSKV